MFFEKRIFTTFDNDFSILSTLSTNVMNECSVITVDPAHFYYPHHQFLHCGIAA